MRPISPGLLLFALFLVAFSYGAVYYLNRFSNLAKFYGIRVASRPADGVFAAAGIICVLAAFAYTLGL